MCCQQSLLWVVTVTQLFCIAKHLACSAWRAAQARQPSWSKPCTLTLTPRCFHAPGMLAGKAPVKTVDAHEPCLLALQALLAVGVAGAAVVEGGTGGAIIANLSASDLRCAPGRAGARF